MQKVYTVLHTGIVRLRNLKFLGSKVSFKYTRIISVMCLFLLSCDITLIRLLYILVLVSC